MSMVEEGILRGDCANPEMYTVMALLAVIVAVIVIVAFLPFLRKRL